MSVVKSRPSVLQGVIFPNAAFCHGCYSSQSREGMYIILYDYYHLYQRVHDSTLLHHQGYREGHIWTTYNQDPGSDLQKTLVNVEACVTVNLKVLPPKYEDVLQLSEDPESSSAADLVSPPPYSDVRAADAGN